MVAGTNEATSVTGTPTVMVPGAVSVMVLPLGEAYMTSCGELLEIALASPL